MSVSDLILDPISILQMSHFYEKHKTRATTATFGLIYAQQV